MNQNLLVRLEYVWLDGYESKNLRSKVRYEELKVGQRGLDLRSCESVLNSCPSWSYDGSSTEQADVDNSDILLNPVRVYKNVIDDSDIPSYFVLCESLTVDEEPIASNTRASLRKTIIENFDEGYWFAPEQEYFIVDRSGKPVDFDEETQEEQGRYYCGSGRLTTGRELVELHAKTCLKMRLSVCGTNAEVAPAQWEYQLSPTDPLRAADDLWMSRYILQRLAEKSGLGVDFSPKPLGSEWNGSGCHINFSTKKMRKEGGKEYFSEIVDSLEKRHEEAMSLYGEGNKDRLTGDCETQHYSKFSWGVADRTASIRVPMFTIRNDWRGYIEDRRPAGNMDPYETYAFLVDATSRKHEYTTA